MKRAKVKGRGEGEIRGETDKRKGTGPTKREGDKREGSCGRG